MRALLLVPLLEELCVVGIVGAERRAWTKVLQANVKKDKMLLSAYRHEFLCTHDRKEKATPMVGDSPTTIYTRSKSAKHHFTPKRPKGSGAHTIKKNKIPNIPGYFRPWRIRIRGRFVPEPMQLFANSKNRILIKIRIWYPARHENRHSPQKLPDIRNFVRRFRICNQKHDSSPQSRDTF